MHGLARRPGTLGALLRILGALLLYAVAGTVFYAPVLLLGPATLADPLGFGLLLLPVAAASGAVLLFTVWVDRRPISSLGLQPQGALRRWALGALAGAIMISLVALVWFPLADGASRSLNPDLGRAALAVTVGLLVFLVQGPSEELLFRGYLLQAVTARWGVLWGLAVSSVLFAALHGVNPGFGPLPMLNLALFGLAAGLYKLLADDGQLWGVFGLHSAWNWLQQLVFGLPNSGQESPAANTLLHIEPDTARPAWDWGGGFGPEGTAATTLVLLGLILLVLLRARARARRGPAAASPPL